MQRTLASLVLVASLVPGPAVPCGINTEGAERVGNGNYRAVVEAWVASRPVADPSLRRVLVGDLDRRACFRVQRELMSLMEQGLEACSGPTSAVALLREAGGKGDANRRRDALVQPEAVRLPHRYAEALAKSGWADPNPAMFDDPGQGPGSCEDYVLIELPMAKEGWVRTVPFCLVHGGVQAYTGFADGGPPRAQLLAMGVRDPELLVLAWDRRPFAVPYAALQAGACLYVVALVLALALALRRPTGVLVSTALTGGRRAACEALAVWALSAVHPAAMLSAVVPLLRAVPALAAAAVLVPRGMWWVLVARRRGPRVKRID